MEFVIRLKYHQLTFHDDSETGCNRGGIPFQPAQNDDEGDDRALSNIYENQMNFCASDMLIL